MCLEEDMKVVEKGIVQYEPDERLTSAFMWSEHGQQIVNLYLELQLLYYGDDGYTLQSINRMTSLEEEFFDVSGYTWQAFNI